MIFGGYSAEYIVSLESASAVIKNLNREKYQPVLIGISRSGDWYYYNGPVESIHNNSWCCEKYCTPAVISPNRSCRDLIILDPSGTYRISVDAALPILHGKMVKMVLYRAYSLFPVSLWQVVGYWLRQSAWIRTSLTNLYL